MSDNLYYVRLRNLLGFAFDKYTISTPCRKAVEVVIQPLLVRTFGVRITKHKIIRIFQ